MGEEGETVSVGSSGWIGASDEPLPLNLTRSGRPIEAQAVIMDVILRATFDHLDAPLYFFFGDRLPCDVAPA